MKRSVWKSVIQLNQILWPCPTCQQPTLELSPKTLKCLETRNSKLNHKNPAWDPEQEEGQFSCFLLCKSCQEPILVAGEFSIDVEPDDEEFGPINYVNQYNVRFISPAPKIVSMPKVTPLEIQKTLHNSFQLYWLDIESCANKIRICVELLLDNLRIKKTIINKNRKRQRLKLHDRIKEFEKKNSFLANLLMAIKWLGNAGSHKDPLRRNDVLDAYEMLEHLLTEIYAPPAKSMAKIAKQINKTKKPRWSSRKPAF